MPLRLTANEANLSGHRYADVLGIQYEFPRRYATLMTPGERFVYYCGRRRPGGGTQPQVYLGTGIVGVTGTSPDQPGHLVAQIDDWVPFAVPVPFKDDGGRYYESGARQGGYYWQAGVRRITEEEYERIIEAASDGDVAANAQADRATVASSYASQELLRAVDEYAVRVAERQIRARWPRHQVEVLPHNNRGFDVRVGPALSPYRYVEVKGTSLPYPRFFLSEGERSFASREATNYSLIVVYAVDVEAHTHETFTWDGDIMTAPLAIEPRQWVCQVRMSPDRAGSHDVRRSADSGSVAPKRGHL
jgi:hypothetical protein